MSTSPAGRSRRLREQNRLEQELAEIVGLVGGILANRVVLPGDATRPAEWARASGRSSS